MSAQKPRILITGATGQVGQKTISFLQNNDSIEIVAAVRSAAKAQAFQDKGIATVILDFDNEATYTDALKDIDRIFIVTGYTVDMLRQSKALLDATQLPVGIISRLWRQHWRERNIR